MPEITRNRNVVMALLLTVTIISTFDKLIFAFAGVQIIEELKLTPEQFGFVGSSFFFLYSLSGVLVGFLANRIATRRILVGMSLVWISAQMLAAFSHGLLTLVCSRLLLGIGTGPATAVTQHASFKWFPPKERMLPSSLIYSSIMFGGILGALTLPYAIQYLGWRITSLSLALIGIIWIILWMKLGREGNQKIDAEDVTSEVEHEISHKALLFNPTFICITLLAFFCYVPSALGVSWTIVYLKNGMNLSTLQSGYFMLAVTVLAMITVLTVSSLAQRALKRGGSLFWTMIVPPLACCAIGGFLFSLIGISSNKHLVILSLMFTGTALISVLPSFSMTITSHFTPVHQRASVLAIHNALQTSAGVLVPFLVGQLIAWNGNNVSAGFELTISGFGIATFTCAIAGFWLVNPESVRLRLQAQSIQYQLGRTIDCIHAKRLLNPGT
ncbi:MFS transporter [Pseudomonas sp. NFX15]|uniref:MFS transporter n=1 Tax=Pseudomonas sp. NFX15 TaxID=2816958 RepID=UPI003B8BEE76